MCSGIEPLLMGAGEASIADMVGLGAGDLIASGAPEAAGAGAAGGTASLADMGAGYGADSAALSGTGAAGTDSYLASLGGTGTAAGSQFASDLAPFTSGATDVASITGNAAPGLQNNIGSFDGIPASSEAPIAQENLPGLAQGSNIGAANAGTMGSDYSSVIGQDSTAMTGSPFSLSNLMNNPMGAVKSAYDTVSNNPIASIYAGSSLYDMYAKKKMAEEQKALYNQNRADIMNTYTPGSPEYNQLYQQMARKDAATGRNSQYGTRGNDLAATIAKLRMNAIGNLQSGQNTLANQAMSNQYGMFNTPLALTMYSQRRDPSRGTAE